MKTLNPTKLLLYFFFSISILSFTSCGDDKDDIEDCNINFSIAFEDELDAINIASIAFANDPTPENCNAYKTAFLDYITALEGLEACYRENGYGDEFEMSVEEAKDSIDTLQC